MLRITSRRGVAYAPAKIGKIEVGLVFIPFHYGYWDNPGHPRAANELTLFEWDAVSKQPHFKYSAVRIDKIIRPDKPEPEKEESKGLAGSIKQAEKKLMKTIKKQRNHISDYLGLLVGSEQGFADALSDVASHHASQPDIYSICILLSDISKKHVKDLQIFIDRYGEHKESEPERMKKALYPRLNKSSFGLLRDIHDLWLFACESYVSINVLIQAAKALRDKELELLLSRLMKDNNCQRSWIETRIKQAAPQTLVVPE
jgi:hypothetical protein